jgi:hypothetical protein
MNRQLKQAACSRPRPGSSHPHRAQHVEFELYDADDVLHSVGNLDGFVAGFGLSADPLSAAA